MIVSRKQRAMPQSRQVFLFLLCFVAFIGFRTVSMEHNALLSANLDEDDEDNTTTAVITTTTKTNTDTHTATSTDQGYFNKIQQMTYEKAIKAPSATTETKTRKPFSLDNWEKGTGGLDDQDRLTLGDLYLKANSVFEFGLGESTKIAAAVGVPRYAGIDSDAVWVAKAREDSNMDHFRFYFADIGPTVTWGQPANKKLDKIVYNYQMASLAAELEAFDVYLVDGRYRVACACASFLHAIKHGADMSKVRVGLHDNDITERNYAVLKNIADVEIENKKLWVYKLKKTTTEKEIYEMWMTHFHPDKIH